MESFLDSIKDDGRCRLICHDVNHNGDVDATLGCGNPKCWKHVVNHSTLPQSQRHPFCRCPVGTFPEEKTKFTPGPWETHHSTDVTGYPCYFIHGFSGDEKRDTQMHEANARLIAVAPEMYDVMCAFVEAWNKSLQLEKTDMVVRQARVLLARINGESK